MKKLILILCLVGICSIAYGEEDKHIIDFLDLENTWIDYDYEQSKWIYNGDLEQMEETIKDCISDIKAGHGVIVLEIIRELKEKKDEENNYCSKCNWHYFGDDHLCRRIDE